MTCERQAVLPLNPQAVQSANAAIRAETGGRPLHPTAPEDAELRSKWLDYYERAGGQVQARPRTSKRPRSAIQPCPRLSVLVVDAPPRASVGDTITVRVLRYNSPNPSQSERQSVSWAVTLNGKEVEVFESVGETLQYNIPYIGTGIDPPGSRYLSRTPLDERLSSAGLKPDRTYFVNQELVFHAYLEDRENRGASDSTRLEPNYERFDRVLQYMYNQMQTNANGSTVRQIKRNFQVAHTAEAEVKKLTAQMKDAGFFQMLGYPDLINAYSNQASSNTMVAYTTFFLKVREGGPWDHKGGLKENYQAERDAYIPIRGDTEHEYYFDIWSNVHYAYVGRAAGFTEQSLMYWGAEVSGGPFGTNDGGDVISVQIGLDLWTQHGLALTQDDLRRAILAKKDQFLAHAASDPENRKIIKARNGW